jgi:DNA mismatch endonuclease (patch repair protein)
MADQPEAPSFAVSPHVRTKMQNQRRFDTRPELALRKSLHKFGLRFRLQRQIVPGTRRRVDIAFGPARVAVFVDGCFWHGCPEHHPQPPKTNEWFWPDKIAGNQARDADTTQRLSEAGWIVIRVWEHEDLDAAATRIAAAIASRRGR